MALFLKHSLRVTFWLGATTALGCLVHIHPDANPGKLSAEEEAVQIFFKEQKLPCDSWIDMGHIQATAGEELEPGEELTEYATFEKALGWLKKEAVKRGASGVIIYDRKQSQDQATYFITGVAIRCAVGNPAAKL